MIKFAGLFDTVTAVAKPHKLDFNAHNADNPGVRLWIDPARVERAVHIIANHETEYRHNFSSNLLNEGSGFTELVVYGAHSDIGGGYHSRSAFDNKDYWLPRVENLFIASSEEERGAYGGSSVPDDVEKDINDELVDVLNKEVAAGWRKSDYFITKVEVANVRETGKGGRMKKKYSANLMLRRLVEGDLSRLYLRAMCGLAEYEKVPLKMVDKNKEDIWTTTVVPDSLYYTIPDEMTWFKGLCEKALAVAKEGNTSNLRNLLVTDINLHNFRALNMIHHSSNNVKVFGFIPMEANVINGVYQREAYVCSKT